MDQITTGSEIITHDQYHKATKLLNQLSGNMNAVTDVVDRLTQQVNDGQFDTKKGLSLLDLKNNMFLSYMCNLLFITQTKLSGKSLVKNPVIDRLIEQRIVIERLNPFESKLKHQIQKYLKADSEGTAEACAAEDAPSKGMAVEDFASGDTDVEDEDVDSDEEDGDTRQNKDVRYKVPKVSQNKYPDDTADEDKVLAARRRLLNSTMMQDALYEHSTDPDIIHHSSALQRKAQKKRDEIQRYEEDHLTRLPLSKKDRAEMQMTSTAGSMHGELLGFSDVSILSGGTGERPAKRRRTSDEGKRRSKGKKKSGKRRR